jgi:hypothetical protein
MLMFELKKAVLPSEVVFPALDVPNESGLFSGRNFRRARLFLRIPRQFSLQIAPLKSGAGRVCGANAPWHGFRLKKINI